VGAGSDGANKKRLLFNETFLLTVKWDVIFSLSL
jgi:hypothetical protein